MLPPKVDLIVNDSHDTQFHFATQAKGPSNAKCQPGGEGRWEKARAFRLREARVGKGPAFLLPPPGEPPGEAEKQQGREVGGKTLI